MCVLQRGQGLFDPLGSECLGLPGVQRIEDRVLAQVNGERVIDLVSSGVLVGEAAPVVGVAGGRAILPAPDSGDPCR